MISGSTDEAVLFIHSTGTGPFLWSTVPAPSLGGRRALFPANLGYSPNPPIERGVRVSAADDAVQVLASIPADLGRIHVVGHSYGGLVGLRVLASLRAADEARVASAFFFEPVLFGALAKGVPGEDDAVAQARSFLAHPWFLTDEEKGGREDWLEMFVEYWNRPGSWKKMPAPMREHSLAVGWKMFEEVRSCFGDETGFDAWLPEQTTIAFGDRSPVGSRAMARALAAGRSSVRSVEVAGAGHMAPLTSPALVHDALGLHLARCAR